MRRFGLVSAVAIALFTPAGLAQQAGTDGPYKVLKTAKVGGEGGFDYIYADVAGRRLYIPRGGTRAVPATDTTPAVAAVPGRITAFNLDTLEPLGEIPGTGGNGVAVDPKSGHGFSSSKTSFEVEQNLQTMTGARTLTFDSKTNHILTMSVERGPALPPLPAGGRAGQAPAIPGSFSILVIGK